MSRLGEIREQYPIGTEVCFDKETFVDYLDYYDENKRVAKQATLREAARGQVIGATYAQEGQYAPSSEGPEWGYEPAYLSYSKSILVLLVKVQYRGKTFRLVRPEDVIWAMPLGSATRVPLQGKMSGKVRKQMSEDMKCLVKDYPRDEKGRFKKG